MLDLPLDTFESAEQARLARDFATAEKLFKAQLEKHPQDTRAMRGLGQLFCQTDRFKEAMEILSRSLTIDPNDRVAMHYLGLAFGGIGKLQESANCYKAVIEAYRDYEPSYLEMARLLIAVGQVEESIRTLRTALNYLPDSAAIHADLAGFLCAADRPEEAEPIALRAIELDAYYRPAYSAATKSLGMQKRFAQALPYARKAVDLAPNSASEWANYGGTLLKLLRIKEADDACQTAIKLAPNSAGAIHLMGMVLESSTKYKEAAAVYARAYELDPKSYLSLNGQAMTTLVQADFNRGWPLWERRMAIMKPVDFWKPITQPLWSGNDIAGKTLLIQPEGGFGDVMQFCRFVPILAQRGIKVLVGCQPQLIRLLGTLSGVTQLVSSPDHLQPYDLEMLGMSVGSILKITEKTIPRDVPYLFAAPNDIETWRIQLGPRSPGELRIGILWAGNPSHASDARRSFRLADMAPLAAIPNAHFYCMQLGNPKPQLLDPPPGMRITDITPDLNDFADSAAALENLDLLITCDSAPAHLAGAIGRPVWVMLPFAGEWRWLVRRSDSPWYPTMRLFRQPKVSDWKSVFEEAAKALAEFKVIL